MASKRTKKPVPVVDWAEANARYVAYLGTTLTIKDNGVFETRLGDHLDLACGLGATIEESREAFRDAVLNAYPVKKYLRWATKHPTEDAAARARPRISHEFQGPERPPVCECSVETGPCVEAIACIDDTIEFFMTLRENEHDVAAQRAASSANYALRKHRDAAGISRETMDKWAAPWWQIAWDRERVCA